MEVGKNWPFPAEWGFPKVIPDRARLDDEAASRFMAEWASMQIRKRQRRTLDASSRTTAAQARLRLLRLRARLLET